MRLWEVGKGTGQKEREEKNGEKLENIKLKVKEGSREEGRQKNRGLAATWFSTDISENSQNLCMPLRQ